MFGRRKPAPETPVIMHTRKEQWAYVATCCAYVGMCIQVVALAAEWIEANEARERELHELRRAVYRPLEVPDTIPDEAERAEG